MAWLDTPLALDPYSRMMALAFDEAAIIGVSTAFQSLFGRGGALGVTKFSPDALVFDIDIIRGNKKTSALLPRSMISQPIGTTQKDTQVGKYTTFSRLFPWMLEEGSIDSNQLKLRLPGENPYTPTDAKARMRALSHRMHQEQIRRCVRTFEILAAQSIIEGKQDAGGGEEIDFKRKATHTTTGSAAWTTITTDIDGDLNGYCDLVRQDGNANPDFVICGENGIIGILKNTQLLAWADNRRIGLLQAGSLNAPPMPPEFQPLVDGGMQHRGFIETTKGYKLHVFSYIDTYQNAAGTEVPYLNADYVIVGSSKARCDRYFGPPERLPLSPAEEADMRYFMGVDQQGGMLPANMKAASGVITPDMFYFDAYKSGRRTFTVETQSAPVFATTQTDAWVLADIS